MILTECSIDLYYRISGTVCLYDVVFYTHILFHFILFHLIHKDLIELESLIFYGFPTELCWLTASFCSDSQILTNRSSCSLRKMIFCLLKTPCTTEYQVLYKNKHKLVNQIFKQLLVRVGQNRNGKKSSFQPAVGLCI